MSWGESYSDYQAMTCRSDFDLRWQLQWAESKLLHVSSLSNIYLVLPILVFFFFMCLSACKQGVKSTALASVKVLASVAFTLANVTPILLKLFYLTCIYTGYPWSNISTPEDCNFNLSRQNRWLFFPIEIRVILNKNYLYGNHIDNN